jgi:hypothetical protein
MSIASARHHYQSQPSNHGTGLIDHHPWALHFSFSLQLVVPHPITQLIISCFVFVTGGLISTACYTLFYSATAPCTLRSNFLEVLCSLEGRHIYN